MSAAPLVDATRPGVLAAQALQNAPLCTHLLANYATTSNTTPHHTSSTHHHMPQHNNHAYSTDLHTLQPLPPPIYAYQLPLAQPRIAPPATASSHLAPPAALTPPSLATVPSSSLHDGAPLEPEAPTSPRRQPGVDTPQSAVAADTGRAHPYAAMEAALRHDCTVLQRERELLATHVAHFMKHAETLALRVGEAELREAALQREVSRGRLECAIMRMTCASLEAEAVDSGTKLDQSLKTNELLTLQLKVRPPRHALPPTRSRVPAQRALCIHLGLAHTQLCFRHPDRRFRVWSTSCSGCISSTCSAVDARCGPLRWRAHHALPLGRLQPNRPRAPLTTARTARAPTTRKVSSHFQAPQRASHDHHLLTRATFLSSRSRRGRAQAAVVVSETNGTNPPCPS